jgi:tRNA A37 threonylcarbamoyladenosine biosynthesis protein TsaE
MAHCVPAQAVTALANEHDTDEVQTQLGEQVGAQAAFMLKYGLGSGVI